MGIGVRRAIAGDEPAITNTITAAFHDDPLCGWIFPDGPTRAARSSPWWRFWVERSLDAGTAFVTDGCEAAALWVAPGAHELDDDGDAALIALLTELLGSRTADVLAGLVQFPEAHPAPPHWYLGVIGTHPDHAGNGVGQALLAENLARVDAAASPSYLESTNPANIPIYERLGYEVCGAIALPDGPTVTPMWRPARG